MANVDRPFGLRPVGYLGGANWSGRCRMYYIPDTDDTNVFAIGDPVTLTGGADTNGIPGITLATAGTANLVLGAIVSGAGSTKFGAAPGIPAEAPIKIPATKDRAYYVMVADDPMTIFECQETNGGTALTAAEVGLNVNLKSGTASINGISGWTLDNSGETTTATLQLKLLRLVPRVDNALGLAAKWEVLINHHQFKPGALGV